MGLRGILSAWAVLVALGLGGLAQGFDARRLGINEMEDDLVYNEKEIKGNWGERESWRGALCDGYYRFDSNLTAAIRKVDIQLKDDGSLEFNADLRDIVAGVGGQYRSELSLCLGLKAGHHITVDWADAQAVVTFVEKGPNEAPDVIVKVLSTRLGRIHLNAGVPRWMEDVLTNVVNSGLKKVWASCLGEWLNKRIAEIIKKKFPTP